MPNHRLVVNLSLSENSSSTRWNLLVDYDPVYGLVDDSTVYHLPLLRYDVLCWTETVTCDPDDVTCWEEKCGPDDFWDNRTCGNNMRGPGLWDNVSILEMSDAFKWAPKSAVGLSVQVNMNLSLDHESSNFTIPEIIDGTITFWPAYQDKVNIAATGGQQDFNLSKSSLTTYFMTSKLHKLIKLPGYWDEVRSWFTKHSDKAVEHTEYWSYSMWPTSNPDLSTMGSEDGVYRASIIMSLPDDVVNYEEQETVAILSTFGVAAGTWSLFVLAIKLLLPLRPSGRRRVWPCCWRLSARLLRQENKNWRKNDIHHEMRGDIEEGGNQPGDADIAVLELPSMEDRMARTERALRRLLNPSRPRKLKLRRLHQQRGKYKALRQQKGRLLTAPLQQPHAPDEGGDTNLGLVGSGGGGVWEAKQ